MKRTLQALASFWPALMLVSLIFSTMIEGTRTNIEHLSIQGYLTRWVLLVLPTVLFWFLAEKSSAAPAQH